MQEHSEVNGKWKDQFQDFRQSNACRELFGIDGERIEFEWNSLPGFTSLQILRKIQENLEVCQTRPQKFEDRIKYMSMFNDIDWTKANSQQCLSRKW